MAAYITLWINIPGDNRNENIPITGQEIRDFPTIEEYNWSYERHLFLYWNTLSDGSGTIYHPGDKIPAIEQGYYAIWEVDTNYVVKKSELISMADAIRAKGGTSEALSFPNGFVSAVQAFPDAMTLDSLSVTENGVYTPSSGHAYSEVAVSVAGGGGDTDAEDGIITRTISTYTNSRVTNVGKYALAYYNGLTAVSFPICTTISDYAFYNCVGLSAVSFPMCSMIGSFAFSFCTKLTAASFPECLTIGNNAFYNCSSLTTASFPVCTTIGSSVFNGCIKLSIVSFPSCTTIGDSAFYSCSSLTAANFPMCKSIGSGAFGYCIRLTTASFSSCTMIGSNAFYSCSNLTTVSFPVCKSIEYYAFGYCYSLTTVSFPVCSTIGNSAFRRCSALYSAYFLGSSVPKISGNTFADTRITSTTGTPGSVFVRASMLAAFQSASYWSSFSTRIVGLTDEEIAALDNNS